MNGEPCFYKRWSEKGVPKIKDLLAQDYSFLSNMEFKAKYNVNCDFLSYYGLIQAIPIGWKNIIKSK